VKRLSLFPDTTKIENDQLTIGGQNLAALAEQFGTPLYIYDRATLDLAVADYQSALRSYYPAPASVTYAGKAFLCKAIAQWKSALHHVGTIVVDNLTELHRIAELFRLSPDLWGNQAAKALVGLPV